MNTKMTPTAEKRFNSRAFTLVEIMIVVVATGLLATLIIIGGPALFRSIRVNNAASDYKTELAIISDASAKLGGTLPITEGGSSIAGLTSGTNLGSSTAANFYNNARLEQVLMAVSDNLISKYLNPGYGSQNFARADAGTANDLTYNSSTGLWSNNGADTTITATMSYAAVTRMECATINSAAVPGVDGTNFRITGGTANLPSGGRVAFKIIKGMPAGEAYRLAYKLNGNSLMTDTSGAGTVAQTNGICTYAAATSGTTDVYIYYAHF